MDTMLTFEGFKEVVLSHYEDDPSADDGWIFKEKDWGSLACCIGHRYLHPEASDGYAMMYIQVAYVFNDRSPGNPWRVSVSKVPLRLSRGKTLSEADNTATANTNGYGHTTH